MTQSARKLDIHHGKDGITTVSRRGDLGGTDVWYVMDGPTLVGLLEDLGFEIGNETEDDG